MGESRFEILVDGKSVAKDIEQSLLPNFIESVFSKYDTDIELVVKRYYEVKDIDLIKDEANKEDEEDRYDYFRETFMHSAI